MTYRDNPRDYPPTHDPSIALAADYSDALITARRAKNLLILLVLLMLIGQLALFFTAKYSNVIPVNPNPTSVPIGKGVDAAMAAGAGSIDTAAAITQPAISAPSGNTKAIEWLQYAVALTGFLGITLSLVLSVSLLLLVMVMLVGRLVGVARLVSAFIWSLVLIVLLFPWQAFLADAHFVSDFKVPGVLYTWAELVRFAKLGVNTPVEMNLLILHWARFVAFPVLTLIITLVIQVKSNRGLREALGEVDAVMAIPT